MEEPSPSRSGLLSRSGSSRIWLLAAVVATLACVALVTVLFLGLQTNPLSRKAPVPVSGDAASGERLTVAIARTPGGPAEWSSWARVTKTLSEELGMPVTVRYVTREQQAVEIIRSEGVDVAFVCPNNYLSLSESGEWEGICTPMIEGKATFRYAILVRADDPAERLEDLRGASMAASDKSSLGGYSFLSYICKEKGLGVESFFGVLELGGTQDEHVRMLANGEVRAAVVNTAQTGEHDSPGFKTVEVSPPVGCAPVIASSSLDEGLRERITRAFLEMKPSELLAEESRIDGFVRFDPAAFDYARRIRGACGHKHGLGSE